MSASFQLPSAPNNFLAKVSYLVVAYSATLHTQWNIVKMKACDLVIIDVVGSAMLSLRLLYVGEASTRS